MTVVLAIALTTALAFSGTDPPSRQKGPPAVPPEGDRVTSLLGHIYAVHLSLRACTEAAEEHRKPELLPAVSLEQARAAMRRLHAAAREAGFDVDAVWREASPVAVMLAEKLKDAPAGGVYVCAKVSGLFKLDLGDLQDAFRALGSKRTVIDDDF